MFSPNTFANGPNQSSNIKTPSPWMEHPSSSIAVGGCHMTGDKIVMLNVRCLIIICLILLYKNVVVRDDITSRFSLIYIPLYNTVISIMYDILR